MLCLISAKLLCTLKSIWIKENQDNTYYMSLLNIGWPKYKFSSGWGFVLYWSNCKISEKCKIQPINLVYVFTKRLLILNRLRRKTSNMWQYRKEIHQQLYRCKKIIYIFLLQLLPKSHSKAFKESIGQFKGF